MAFNLMPDVGPPVHLSQMGDTFARPGIYFLWQGDTVVYVGQSRQMAVRVLQHACDRKKTFDGISCRPCGVSALLKKERFFIETLLPRYNRCGISEAVRRVWMGHMDDRPVPNRRVGPDLAAQILGVTPLQLAKLAEYGLKARKFRVPRRNVRRSSYSVRDLHQFSAQKAEKIRAVRNLYPDQAPSA